MFLDEQLYQKVKETKIESSQDFEQLMNDLFLICENKWKPEFDQKNGGKGLKVLLDRTFKSWDIFAQRLEKENWFLIQPLNNHSYKLTFMLNEKLRKEYLSL